MQINSDTVENLSPPPKTEQLRIAILNFQKNYQFNSISIKSLQTTCTYEVAGAGTRQTIWLHPVKSACKSYCLYLYTLISIQIN